ncbi:hypothetical protein GCK72_002508 [Caenorhabditis remanei]|uniref:Uncharacterized protein n=1 Tax=Caenorhabditis remanei TaxID=31234 RepID=A0A6A5HWG6_CAERE|nr:hypothetical protein GCK72_002508 [Caenorhabditis remanei]KAF1770687.1 hypothetical protein GCK72_002508 [Caenorhabditis remanei]
MGYLYATNMCDSDYKCLLQFKETCLNGDWLPRPNPLVACKALDQSVYSFQPVAPYFHVFQTIDLACNQESKIMIGRPKVFCNATAMWEVLPQCVYQSCSDLTQFIPPHMTFGVVNPLGNGFEAGTVVYFSCDHGYILSPFVTATKCVEGPSGYIWSEDIPTCIPPTSTAGSTLATTTYTTGSSPFTFPFIGTTLPATPSTSVAGSTLSATSSSVGSTLSATSSSVGSTLPATSSSVGSTLPATPSTSVAGSTLSANSFSTVSGEPFVAFDDVVIEGSMTFEEKNMLDQPQIWTQTGDWIWTPSGCIVHQWTFPISFFVTSIPIRLNSNQIELLIDISQCNSSVQVSVTSSSDGFIPPISDFRPVMNTTSSGSFVVKLSNLKQYLAVAITANGYVQVCGVTIRENICDEVDYNGLHLASSIPFSMRRYLPATCGSSGYCDGRRGWVIQNKPCICQPTPQCATIAPIRQLDTFSECSLNSCQNGVCQQHDGYFNCLCNQYFISAVTDGGEPYCKPDHCSFTSDSRNSGYDCETGNINNSKTCNESYFGNFCQYKGTLANNSYIYLLEYESDEAIATNVCESVDTEYAMHQVNCSNEPTTTLLPNNQDPCTLTCHAGSCQRSPPPFNGGVICMCDTDQYGRQCTVSKFCYNESASNHYTCLNGGTCSVRPDKKCFCLSNFGGDYCETPLVEDNCYEGEKDCVHGSCRRENDRPYCNCDSGFIRDSDGNCTVLWDMCYHNNPCQQYGSCMFNVTSGVQNCNCTSSGWQGDYCELPPVQTDCSVCQHVNKCFDNFTSNARCQCSPGFSGDFCSDPVEDCLFEPCFNSGTCNYFNVDIDGDLIETYNCTCPTGYNGTNCETRVVPDCNTFICENGGTCEMTSHDTARCQCTTQFYGDHCEKSCSHECAHSYGCTQNTNGSILCDCYDGFLPPLCDKVDDVCKANVLFCQNSGTCNSTTESCDCPNYYDGTYCEKNTNLCETNSIFCENGGICNPSFGNCTCSPNFTGDRCENQINTCRDINCFNGGTCLDYNATCQPCIIYNPDGSTQPYCKNNGNCTNLENGASCDCNGTEFTGRRCEIRANFNFNLVFNGMNYAPEIVSRPFYDVSIAQFTICSFVQYNHPVVESTGTPESTIPTLLPWLVVKGYSKSQMMVFDNKGFFICNPDDAECTREEISKNSNFRQTPITANTWHHYCIVSPEDQTSPSYTVYLDGLPFPQLAPLFNPGTIGYLQLAPPDLTKRTDDRFVGMISMTQLYIIRLSETQINQLAFDCYTIISETNTEIANNTLISWNGGFTRVSSSNPGVFIDPSGICSSVKCMFGRQAKSNNYNSTGSCAKDRISPTVLKCPANKNATTTEDFIKVTWSDDEISFFDNIGVVRVEVNYHNGQQFGVGITAVRYIAYDAAGNSAECTFDVIVVQKSCPSNDQIVVDNGRISFGPTRMAPFTSKVVLVECDDNLYPIDNRPGFYVCDIMGNFNYGGWVDDTQKKYYLPACGKTVPAVQEINGTVLGNGTCKQVFEKLRETIWSAANCNQQSSCSIMILPPCNETNSVGNTRETENDDFALQYTFSTSNATETISTSVLKDLQDNFRLVRQDSTVDCDPSFPIHDTSGNVTVCVSCADGTFANTTANECTDCPIDTYRNSASHDQFACTSCPDKMITGDVTGAVDESQCYQNCIAGQYESKGVCLPCPEGTFAPREGLRRCICCGFDLSTYGNGSTSFDECQKTCDPGQEMIRSETEFAPYCQDCAVGFYKEDTRGPCIQCPRGLITASHGSKSINDCNVLHCIDQNTRRNGNIKVGPNTVYSEMCITCEQGTFQNKPNSDSCIQCSDLSDDITDVPVTCQSTCSAEIPTEGCNCQLQKNETNSMIIRNCVPEVQPDHKNSNAIKIILPIVFGVLLIIIVVVLFCFRKQIIAWVRKSDTSDNQHVAVSHWNPQRISEEYSPHYTSDSQSSIRARIKPPAPTIPRPNLRIVTSREEMDQLPPLPSSSTPSFHVDSAYNNSKHVGFSSGIPSSSRNLRSNISTIQPLNSSNNIFFEANGSPKIIRERTDTLSDDSSLGSFF